MPLIDGIVAGIVLGATFGILVFRSLRMWADFRSQRRSVDLLVRTVTELEALSRERKS